MFNIACFRMLNDGVEYISGFFKEQIQSSLVHYKWVLPCGCLHSRGGGLWLVIATGLSGIDDAAEKKEVVKSVAKINGLLRGPIYNLYGKDLKLTHKKKLNKNEKRCFGNSN